MIFAVLDLRVAEVVLKRRFKVLSFFTIINSNDEANKSVNQLLRCFIYDVSPHSAAKEHAKYNSRKTMTLFIFGHLFLLQTINTLNTL